MAFTPNPYSTTNVEGVDVLAVYTPSTATSTAFVPEYPAAPFLPGTRVSMGYGNSEYVFVNTAAATSISKGNVCVLSTGFSAAPLTTTIAATAGFGLQMGVAMATAATGSYLWMQTRGASPAISAVASAGFLVPLYSTATAGTVTSTAATGTNYPVYGITLISVATTTATLAVGNITSIELGGVVATSAVAVAF